MSVPPMSKVTARIFTAAGRAAAGVEPPYSLSSRSDGVSADVESVHGFADEMEGTGDHNERFGGGANERVPDIRADCNGHARMGGAAGFDEKGRIGGAPAGNRGDKNC